MEARPANTHLRQIRRRVPPERRQRAEISCDRCRNKRCKCIRSSTTDTCQACRSVGQPCQTTRSRKYNSALAPFEDPRFDKPQPQSIQSLHPPTSPPAFDLVSAASSEPPTTSSRVPLSVFNMPTERLPVDPPLSTVDHIPSSQTTPTASGVHFLVYDPSTVDLVSLTTTDPVSSLKSEAPVQHGTGDHNIDLPPREVADTLIKLFFDKVHCDFPILHRTLFQVHYEKTRASTKYRHDHQYTPKPDPAWLVCLFMVFVLGLEDIDGGDSAMEALGGLLGCGISGSGSPGTSGNSRSRSSGGSGGSGGNGSTAANSPRHTSPVRPQIATRLQLVRGLLSPPLWVDVNHYDHRGQTVLIAFVTYIPDDQEDKAKSLAALFGLLLAAGARLEGRNRRGETALLVAARLGRTIALTSLLGHGANVHVRDMKGRGVLDVIDKQCRHAAHKDVALYGRLEACRVLLTGKKYLFLGAKQRPTLLDEWSAVPAGGWRGL